LLLLLKFTLLLELLKFEAFPLEEKLRARMAELGGPCKQRVHDDQRDRATCYLRLSIGNPRAWSRGREFDALSVSNSTPVEADLLPPSSINEVRS